MNELINNIKEDLVLSNNEINYGIEELKKNLSVNELDYILYYSLIEKKIDSNSVIMKEIEESLKDNKIPIEFQKEFMKLYNEFNILKENFKSIKLPIKMVEKQENENPIEIDSVTKKNILQDLVIVPNLLIQLKPEKILAKNQEGIDYYQISTTQGLKFILRINTKKLSQQISIYDQNNINELEKDKIEEIILLAEQKGSFRNVQIMINDKQKNYTGEDYKKEYGGYIEMLDEK